jgi:hypothetical protein
VSVHKFSFMLKSYVGDLESATLLIESFRLHNVGGLPLYVVVPLADVALFEPFASQTIVVIPDESIPVRMAKSDVNGIRAGYINQELVKLGFYQLGLTQAYLCLDSDAVFLNDFSLSDFLHSSGTPYSVLVEDRELQGNVAYFEEHWGGRGAKLAKIREFLGLPPANVYLTCHGFQIFQSSVLTRLSDEILTPRAIDFLDLLEISPYEFSWYNYYLQTLDVPIFVREPYFRVVHNGQQFATERMAGFTAKDWSRGYLGLVLNSNFQHTSAPAGYDSWAPYVMAIYTKPSFLFAVWGRVSLALMLSLGKTPASIFMGLINRGRSSRNKLSAR